MKLTSPLSNQVNIGAWYLIKLIDIKVNLKLEHDEKLKTAHRQGGSDDMSRYGATIGLCLTYIMLGFECSDEDVKFF